MHTDWKNQNPFHQWVYIFPVMDRFFLKSEQNRPIYFLTEGIPYRIGLDLICSVLNLAALNWARPHHGACPIFIAPTTNIYGPSQIHTDNGTYWVLVELD